MLRDGEVHVIFGRTGGVIPVGKELLRRVGPGLVYDESSYASNEDL